MDNMDTEQTTKNKNRKKDIGMWIVYGFMIGTIAGLVFGNLPTGMGIGICLGIVIGAIANR